jgi:bifunctional non-homologous end joining protein LigD
MEWPIAPMKAVLGRRLPQGDAWRYEPKWDGYRAIVRKRDDRVDIVSSTGKPRTASWPWLVDAIRAATDRDVIVDGEVIAYTADGRHSFQAVGRADVPHGFVAFDLLALDGTSLLGRPWHERRGLLTATIPATPPISITPVSDDADTMVAVTMAQHFEGVVAKRIDSTYLPGKRAPSWVKLKHRSEQEMVVGGWKVGEGARVRTFGSLLVGVYDDAGTLQFVAAVGTGFDDRTLEQLTALLRPLATDTCPFGSVPKLPGRPELRWVRPELVVQVAFAEWTDGGGVRAPVYLGLRDDKRPEDVVRE